MLNRQIAIVAVAVIATVAFFSFKSGDDRNFQIAKNLDIFNAIVKEPVSYTHLRAHETRHDLVCRLLLEKKKKKNTIEKGIKEKKRGLNDYEKKYQYARNRIHTTKMLLSK